MLNRFFAFTRLHTLALLCWFVAALFWKDYFTHPHRQLTRGDLVSFTGTMTQVGTLISLPSGTQSGKYLLLEEAKRSLDVGYVDDFLSFQRYTPEGATLTVTHSPEVDLRTPGESATVFSIQYQGKERVDTDAQLKSYNGHIAKKLRDATFTTLGGFVLFGLVWFVHKRFLQR